MIRQDWSTTSRTGYEPRLPQDRLREAGAILCSMVAVGILIVATVVLARALGL